MNSLNIDGKTISLGEIFENLKISGNLHLLLGELQKQFCLRNEIEKAGESVHFGQPELEQYIIDFRVENQLTDHDSFIGWLEVNWLSYSDFCRQATFYLQLQKLTESITEPLIWDAFLQQQDNLSEVVLSRIVVTDRSIADDLLYQLLNTQASFAQLACQHSIAEDAVVGGAIGLVSKDALPYTISAALKNITEGQVIGVIEHEETYCLLKVEKIVAPALDDSLKEILRDALFEDWLAEKMKGGKVSIHTDIDQSRTLQGS